jgi:glycosyltransferase involved in cell wall biosynthesis
VTVTGSNQDHALRLLRASDLFDAAWYGREYPDVAALGMDAVEHFLRVGADLGRSPGPDFDTAFYLDAYADVGRSGMNPLLHFVLHGRREGRNCRPPSLAQKTSSAPDDPFKGMVARVAGRRRRRAGRPTILVCGHTAGRHLFGGERSLLDIVQGLDALDYNVVVALPPGGNDAYHNALAGFCLDVVAFAYSWWEEPEPMVERAVALFARTIVDYGVDAVHVNTIMLREPLAAARRMGVPSAVHVRELVRHDVALSERIGATPDQIIERALASADFVIANSEATASSFDKPGRTFVVPNTVQLSDFQMQPPAGDESRISIMLVSSNLPKKGVLDFVEVARRLEHDTPQARFVLVGPESEFTAALRAGMAAGTAPQNLVLGGYRADPALAIQEADIVVNLSRFQESFGRTVLEAMAGGRPVVVYDWGALPELVDEGQSGFVVPFGDIEAVAARLRELCADPAALRSMGEAGRRLAVARYGRDSYAASLGTAYAEILPARAEAAARKVRLPARAGTPAAPAEKPRIAYFLWHFPVPSETFVLNELRILVESGFDVRVFCRQSPHAGFKPDFPIQWSTVEDAAELADALVATGRTVVHSHFVFPTVTRMVWPACERAGIPFTFIAHAQDIFRHSNDEQNAIGQIGRSERCLRVLVPSRFHRDYLIERGVPAAKLVINPNGIDPELYQAGLAVDHVARRARSVCAVHRFTEKKGLLALVEAGARLAAEGIAVHLYGYGDEGAAYAARIQALGANNVHLHGAVEGRDGLLEVFARHDLFACPAVRAADGDMDGIPTVLMEAMASGLPVLATAVSGIPELVRDGVTGIVCAPGADGIEAGIRRFYALSDDAVAAMAENALARVRRDYDAARLTAALLRLWQGVAIDAMIVSWNNLPQLREVVRRLYAFTTMPFHLVVCDNGSTPDVAAFLSELYALHDNVTVLYNRDNAKVGPGTNLCLAEGRSPYAVYVCGKEGFVLDFGWERRLVDYMDANPRVGLAGTLCHSPSYLFGRQYPAGVAEFPRFRNQAFATDNPERPFAHVQGGFFVLRRAMYEEVGGFSEAVPHNYTDVEFSFYVESRGWELGQAPGMLALYNKTRPGIFTRVDEGIAAIHPPTLDDLPKLDRIARADGAFCNLCNWQGAHFEGAGRDACPKCGSRPRDRSLLRFLAESALTYRRLPALAVGLGEAIAPFWRQQFQGQPFDAATVSTQLASAPQLDVGTGSRALVYADLGDAPDGRVADWLRECARALAPDGLLLLRAPDARARGLEGAIAAQAQSSGLEDQGRWRRASLVSRYDDAPLRVFRRQACA